MSDEIAAKFEADKQPAPEAAGRSVTQSVTLHPNGQIEFNLVNGNKILAYGLVELMRAQLDKQFMIAEAKASQPVPNGGVAGLMKRMNGR